VSSFAEVGKADSTANLPVNLLQCQDLQGLFLIGPPTFLQLNHKIFIAIFATKTVSLSTLTVHGVKTVFVTHYDRFWLPSEAIFKIF